MSATTRTKTSTAAQTSSAGSSFNTMLAAAERKATNFRSFRAQIRSSLSAEQQQDSVAEESSSSGSSSGSARTLPRVRADATWARFFGEDPEAHQLQAQPVVLTTASPPAKGKGKGKGKQAIHNSNDSPSSNALASAAALAQAGIAAPAIMDPEEKALLFGPNYLPQEDSLRNDFSQRYVDSGAGELPGNAVRNPYVSSRFDEYPKLKRLVEIKEDVVSAKAHAPTYLYADLRASLVPNSYQANRRNHQHQYQQQRTESGSTLGGADASEPSSSKGSRTGSIVTSLSNATSMTSVSGTSSSAAAAYPVPQPFHLAGLMPIKYDVVIIDPPLEVYDWEGVPSRKSGASGLDGPPQQASSAQQGGTATGVSPDPKQTWTWDEIASLPIPQLTAKESFVFLWVGSGAGDGLERGRELLAKWGYRRCEDIVCVRTNRAAAQAQGSGGHRDGLQQASTSSALQRSVQHCLMGIRGTVRRSTDTRFVHCNVDIDVLIWEGDEEENAEEIVAEDGKPAAAEPQLRARDHVRAKPQEMYSLIENFCLGTRRLELFGTNRNLRRGWLTIGLEVGPHAPGFPDALPATYRRAKQDSSQDASDETAPPPPPPPTTKVLAPVAYQKATYDAHFGVDRPGCDLRERKNLLPFSPDMEALRPKSPAPRNAHSRGESENPLTPPPSGPLGLHGPQGSTGSTPGSGPTWGSPAAGSGSGPASSSAVAVAAAAANNFGSSSASPRASPRNSTSLSRTLQHKMSMSPSAFGAGINLPPIPLVAGAGGGGGSSGSGGVGSAGPGSPSRGRHGMALHHHHHQHPHPGGAGLSGLGAGGPKVVSVPSGSETLSGPQASVLFGTKHGKGSGPMGLGRNSRR
ncbi:regulatory protein [Tilletia horrida]|nr:regulatory protein [Tilletia horrida]